MSLRRLIVFGAVLALPVALRAQSRPAWLEVEYAVPSGYVERYEGGELAFLPQNPNDVRTPCLYGLLPAGPSSGSLEADAETALAGAAGSIGLQRSNHYRIARRGVAAAGWPYFLLGGEFQGRSQAGDTGYLAVMAMVFPASTNRVNVLIGFGRLGACMFNDASFAQLFHSLRPRGWSSPAGNGLQRDLIGAWGGSMLSGHTFYADGGYSSSAAGELYGKLISGGAEGRYALRGSEVTVTTRAGQASERFRVSIYDNWNNSRWERTMAVLYDDRRPPYVNEFVRSAQ
jgi:hypothetical protein